MNDRHTGPQDGKAGLSMAGFTLGYGRGLVFIYKILPDQPPQEISLPEAEEMLAQNQGLLWIHLDITSMLAKSWVDTQNWLPPLAREMLVTHEKRTQVHSTPQSLTGILCDFHHELTEVDWRINTLHFYVSRNCLISARRHALAAVERTQQDLMRGLHVSSGIELLSAILESLGDLMDGASENIGRDIEHAEDEIERGDPEEGRAALSETRKRAILFHRQLTAERRSIARFGAKPPAWFADSDSAALQSAIEHLSSTSDELDTMQLRARLIQDEIAARLAENTNRNLYMLSVISAILLPMTLISGIYGMNLGGLPGVDAPWGFWTGVGEIAIVGAITAVILKITKIL